MEEVVKDRQIVAKGFAAGRAGDDDWMPAGLNVLPGHRLVSVERFNATRL
jgi:hypothetical protein